MSNFYDAKNQKKDNLTNILAYKTKLRIYDVSATLFFMLSFHFLLKKSFFF